MAQDYDITFITEDVPPSPNFIQSSKGLRVSYVARQEVKLITQMQIEDIEAVKQGKIKEPRDLTQIKPSFWDLMKTTWKREAEIKYPDDGDYLVWIVDPVTGVPVPLGEVVEFIGGDIRNNPGAVPCVEYHWDISKIRPDKPEVPIDPNTYIVSMTYTDCFRNVQKMSGTIAKLGPIVSVCTNGTAPFVSKGELTVGDLCDYNYGNPVDCSEYVWILDEREVYERVEEKAVEGELIVSLSYLDCEGKEHKIEGTIKEIGPETYFCALIDGIVFSYGEVQATGKDCVRTPIKK